MNDENNRNDLVPNGEENETSVTAQGKNEKRRRGFVRKIEDVRLDGGNGRKFDTTVFLGGITQILIVISCIAVVVFFGYHLMRGMTPAISTLSVRSSSETVYDVADAYILRRETPVNTGMRGTKLYSVPDGAKVQVGKSLCAVYPNGQAQIIRRLEEIESEISLLGSSQNGGTVVLGIRETTSAAEADYRQIMNDLAAGNLTAAMAVSPQFRTELARIECLTGNAAGISAALSALREERDRLSAELEKTGTVTAEEVGYFFRDCDGYERAFCALLDGKLNAKTLRAAAASAQEDTSVSVGKLITGEKWYIAVPAADADYRDAESGDKFTVIFTENGGLELTMTLESISRPEDEEDDECVLLLYSTRHPEGFDYRRCQSVKIVREKYTGLRIPLAAVHIHDGETGVYVVNGGTVLFRRTEILYEGDGFFIVSASGNQKHGAPYNILGYDTGKFPDAIRGMVLLARAHGWKHRKNDPNGKGVKYGYPFAYYYWLEEFEDVILEGEDLYHGKVLN